MAPSLLDDPSSLVLDAATLESLLAGDPLALGGAADALRRERHGRDAVLVLVHEVPWDSEPAPLDHPEPLAGRERDVPDEIRMTGDAPADAAAAAAVLRSVAAMFPGVPVRGVRPAEAVSLARTCGMTADRLILDLSAAGLSTLQHPAPADPWEETVTGLLAAQAAGMVTDAPVPWDADTTPAELAERLADLASIAREGGAFCRVVPLPCAGPEVSPLESTTGIHDLRVFALSRLLLRNVPHVAVEAAVVGPKLGAIALSFGADTLSGAVTDPTERLRAADAEKPRPFNGDRARALLVECGRTPVSPPREQPGGGNAPPAAPA